MITGALKGQVDRVWDSFWSGGISNPVEVIEQITYLLFIRRLDDLQLRAEKQARYGGGGVVKNAVFLPAQDGLRWSRFKHLDPTLMYQVVDKEVFPFLRELGDHLGGDGSTYSEHIKGARFTIPTAALLSKVVDLLDHIPMDQRDTNGDLYEYLLSKLSTSGVNGQFRTPRRSPMCLDEPRVRPFTGSPRDQASIPGVTAPGAPTAARHLWRAPGGWWR